MDTYGISTWFYLLLPFVAFLYASVGHGGASGYLALMALFSFSPDEMRPLALLLNLLVSAVAFYHYFKRGYFKAGLFWPFALTSIPMAFIGGNLQLESKLYQIILGVLLLIAVMRLLNLFGHEASKLKAFSSLAGTVHWSVNWFCLRFDRNRWRDHTYSRHSAPALGRYEGSGSCFGTIHLGKLCIWFTRAVQAWHRIHRGAFIYANPSPCRRIHWCLFRKFADQYIRVKKNFGFCSHLSFH